MKILLSMIFLFSLMLPQIGQAAIRFLPDVDQREFGEEIEQVNVSVDEKMCASSVDKHGNKLYHKASGCPQGMVFDEYCPHSQNWISECYTPNNPEN